MGRSDFPPLRSLPRLFLPGVSATSPIALPREELDKFKKVLRLERGTHIGILPNDGTLIRCQLEDHLAIPLEVETPDTEPLVHLSIAQALPKGDRFETVLRMGTEIGVSRFIAFPADRSVVRWDDRKLADRMRRFDHIVREAAEQSYRTRLPVVEYMHSLGAVLEDPSAIVLSEIDTVTSSLSELARQDAIFVVGPEGGWSPGELELIGDRGVTMGPLVLRTDTAGIAAAARWLIR